MSTHQANQTLLGEISDLMKREHKIIKGTQYLININRKVR